MTATNEPFAIRPRFLRRRTIIASITVSALVVAAIGVVRSSGTPQHRIARSLVRRWLVHRPTGTLALADPDSGRILVRVLSDRSDHLLETAQNDRAAVLLDRTRGEVIDIDERLSRLGRTRLAQTLTTEASWRYAMTDDGLVAVAPRAGLAARLPLTGPAQEFDVTSPVSASVATTDGRMWSLDTTGATTIVDPDGRRRALDDAADAVLSTSGRSAVVLSRSSGTLFWFPSGDSVALTGGIEAADAVLQSSGNDDGRCVWIGAGNELFCVSPAGTERRVAIDGFQFSRNDRLAATDDVAVVLADNGQVTRIDLAAGTSQKVPYSWASTDRFLGVLGKTVWVDDPASPLSVMVSASGVSAFDKLDQRAPAFGSSGIPLDVGGVDGTGAATSAINPDPAEVDGIALRRRPDDNGRPDPPLALDDQATGAATRPLVVGLTSNDYDPDGGAVAIARTTTPRHGTVTVVDSASVEYRPTPGFSGLDSFRYTIVDTDGMQADATANIEVIAAGAPNAAPIAYADSIETAAGVPVEIDVLANDLDPEALPLRFEMVTPPSPASATFEIGRSAPDGHRTVLVTPQASAAGTAVTFTYRAVDLAGRLSAPAKATITVGANGEPNRPPIAQPDSVRVRPGRTVRLPVLDNDYDPDNDPLDVGTVAVPPAGLGSASAEGALLVVTAAPGASGSFIVNYTAVDSAGAGSATSVLVQIVDDDQANLPPVPRPDLVTADTNEVTIDPLRNDFDPDNDPLSIIRLGEVTGGTAQLLDDQTIRFVRAPGFTGVASVAYDVADGTNIATSLVAIDVPIVASPARPQPQDDTWPAVVGVATSIPVLRNDRQPGGGQLTLLDSPQCPGAICSIAEGRITYTARLAGTRRVTYTVANTVGLTASATVTVTARDAVPVVTNSAPQPADDRGWRVTEGSSITIDALTNDIDPDGDPLRISAIGNVNRDLGVARIRSTNGRDTIVFTAAAGAAGSPLQFEYTVTDPAGATATATINITIVANSANVAPTARNDAFAVVAGRQASFDLTANDDDPDGSTSDLRITLVDAGGLPVGIASDGRSVNVDASGRAAGDTMSFRYLVRDRGGLAGEALVVVTVAPAANLAPTALDDRATTASSTPIDVDVLVNDTDPEGGPLTVRLLTVPPAADGAASVTATGAIRFFPASGFNGIATLRYEAVDAAGASSSPASVSITVNPCGAPEPVATNLLDQFTPLNTPLTIKLLGSEQLANNLTLSRSIGGTVARIGQTGSVVFTPTRGNNGGGSFEYSVQNACGAASRARVEIDVNRAPVTRNITRSITAGDSLTLDVDAVATDDENLRFASATTSAGSVEVGDQRLSFTAAPDSGDSVTITATVVDPGGLTAEARITVTIARAANVAPRAGDDLYATEPATPRNSIPVLVNDVDPDGDNADLRIEVIDAQVDIGGATAEVSSSPNARALLLAVPDGAHGEATIRYRAVDADGGRSNDATVTLIVNRRPSRVAATTNIEIGGTLILRPLDESPAPNDPDGDTLRISEVSSNSSEMEVVLLDDRTIQVRMLEAKPDHGKVTFVVIDSFGARSTSTIDVETIGGPEPE